MFRKDPKPLEARHCERSEAIQGGLRLLWIAMPPSAARNEESEVLPLARHLKTGKRMRHRHQFQSIDVHVRRLAGDPEPNSVDVRPVQRAPSGIERVRGRLQTGR